MEPGADGVLPRRFAAAVSFGPFLPSDLVDLVVVELIYVLFLSVSSPIQWISRMWSFG